MRDRGNSETSNSVEEEKVIFQKKEVIDQNQDLDRDKKEKKRKKKYPIVPWLEEEDETLKFLVDVHNEKEWKLVSKEMCPDAKGIKKIAKQCRERWFNVLKPQMKGYGPIGKENELKLLEKYEDHPKKWAIIAKLIGDTTDNHAKNHYYSAIRKELRYLWKEHDHIFKSPYEMKPAELTIDNINNILIDNNIDVEKLENANIKTCIMKKRHIPVNCNFNEEGKPDCIIPKINALLNDTKDQEKEKAKDCPRVSVAEINSIYSPSIAQENKDIVQSLKIPIAEPLEKKKVENLEKTKEDSIFTKVFTNKKKRNRNQLKFNYLKGKNVKSKISKKNIIKSIPKRRKPKNEPSSFRKDIVPDECEKPEPLPLILKRGKIDHSIGSPKRKKNVQQIDYHLQSPIILRSQHYFPLIEANNDQWMNSSVGGFLLNMQLLSNPIKQMNVCPSLIRDYDYCLLSNNIISPLNSHNL